MLVGLLIAAALLVPPFWVILPKAGLPSWLALGAIIPFGVVVLLWVLMLRRWPGDDLAGRF